MTLVVVADWGLLSCVCIYRFRSRWVWEICSCFYLTLFKLTGGLLEEWFETSAIGAGSGAIASLHILILAGG